MEKKELSKNQFLGILKKNISVVVFVVLVIVSSILSKDFLTSRNIFNLLRQMSGTVIISMGMLMVILTGGIDLSVGSVVALSGVVFAYVLRDHSLFLALLATLAVAALAGAITGYFVSRQNMAAFVVSLATMTAARGFAYIISKGTPIQIKNDAVSAYGKGSILHIPFPVVTAIIIVLLIAFLLKYTSTGRFVQAIGSNETSVRLSGIQVFKYKWLVYIITGVLCAIAGIITDGRTAVGSANVAEGMELDCIAACVIGGANLAGGYGTALNTLIGALILGMISNIMNLMNVPNYPQQVIKGVIIIVAVLAQRHDAKE